MKIIAIVKKPDTPSNFSVIDASDKHNIRYSWWTPSHGSIKYQWGGTEFRKVSQWMLLIWWYIYRNLAGGVTTVQILQGHNPIERQSQ